MRTNQPLVLAMMMAILLGLALSGCGKKAPVATQEVAKPESGAMGPAEPLETEVPEGDTIMEGRTSAPMLPIYFDFDSPAIRADQVPRIETNAQFLKDNPKVRIRIEGNCDPRGTKEYNLALGERRALSAKKYLVNLGIDPDRISTISWGEEKLLLYGHDEISWAQDRRDDFVIVR
ncbi:MAG TPA: OmpA family protein [Desulfobulbus sp.]|nr:OmpA family protein [Desulfobulbus sp.]